MRGNWQVVTHHRKRSFQYLTVREMCLMLPSSIEKKKVKSGTVTDKHSTTEKSYHAELRNRQSQQKSTRKKNIMGEFGEMSLSTSEK